MRQLRRLFVPGLVGLLAPAMAAAEVVLTLEDAVLLARQRAPSVVAAKIRVEEAQARVGLASLPFRQNPELDAAVGAPVSGDNRSTDFDFGLMQEIEIGGRRKARRAIADAELASAVAEADDVLRRAARDVVAAFARAFQAQKRVDLVLRTESIASEILDLARQRHEAGDVALLDVNLARTALARARAALHAARAAQASSFGELRALLGLETEEALRLAGDPPASRSYDLSELLTKADDRADLRALRAELEAAEAETRLGSALAWPELGIGARYEREDEEDRLLGAVRLTLPLFDRGQWVEAEAGARARRIASELEAARRQVRAEVTAAFEVHRERSLAVEEVERGGLDLVEENEQLARESYLAGQISLAELLLVSRQSLEIRDDYLSLLLEAVIAASDLEASSGVMR